MKRHSAFWLILLTGIFSAFFSLSAAEELTLAENGKSTYRILLSADAPAMEVNAAAEFQDFFRQITGAELPILKENELPAGESAADCGPWVFVGSSSAAKKAFPNLSEIEFKEDEILIQSDVSGNLLLTGHAQRGPLYAVVTFLEDTLGCRWWTSKESSIPNSPTLKIAAQNHRFAPKMIYRESYYRDAFDFKFAVHSKCNGHAARIPQEWGGKNHFAFFVHSFYPLIPPTKYFKDHPEWFSEIDGVRKVGRPGWSRPGSEYEAFEKSLKPEQIHARGTQLCLTNDEMRKELTKNALEHIRKNPNTKFISISQNDWYGNCTCEKCRAIDEANGSPSGTLITFVNQVAEEIEKEFPDVFVETLAYQYTRKPPKLVKPRKNVVVRLCTIECSFLQPLESGELNSTLADDIRGWSAIAPQLFVWNYITNFTNYVLPHPNMRCLAPDIRFFVKNKAIGLFNQGDAHSTCGDFVAPRNWVVSHLLWNPDQDEEKLWNEFFTRYYGPAGVHLQNYLKVVHDHADTTGFNLRCFLADTKGWLDPETMLESAVHVEKARKAVESDPVLTLRVDRALVAFDLNWLLRWNELKFYCELQNLPTPGPKDPRKTAIQLADFIEAQDSTRYREWVTDECWPNFRTELIERFPLKPASNPNLADLLPGSETEGRENPDWDSVLWMDFQGAIYIGGREKGWGQKVDEPNASDGRAVQMPGNHYEWACSMAVPMGIPEAAEKWRVYAAVRCEASAADGPAMTCGIYDRLNRVGVAQKNISVPEINGQKYRIVDLGAHKLTSDMYFWFAPPRREGEVQYVYVDRLFLVKEQ